MIEIYGERKECLLNRELAVDLSPWFLQQQDLTISLVAGFLLGPPTSSQIKTWKLMSYECSALVQACPTCCKLDHVGLSYVRYHLFGMTFARLLAMWVRFIWSKVEAWGLEKLGRKNKDKETQTLRIVLGGQLCEY